MPWPTSIPGRKKKTSYSFNSDHLYNSQTSPGGGINVTGDDVEGGVEESPRRSETREQFEDERHKRTWEEKEKEEFFSLEEDLYALMYLCRFPSVTFLVTATVFLLQIFILALIMTDLTREAPTHPEIVFFPLEVPIDVPTQVIVAQFVSLLVATMKEEDIFISLKALIIVGHDERVERRFPGATPWKWWLANICRFTAGLGTVVVSFYFIVGADNVLDIFENFAAMEFISYLDNMVFKLANWGYLGKLLQRMTIKVESVQMENRREKGRWWALLICLFLSLTLVPLITFWSLVRAGQHSGFYLEQSLSPSVVVNFVNDNFVLPKGIQFDFDGTQRNLTSFNPSVPPELLYDYFSGSYMASFNERDRLVRYNGRPIYYERNAKVCENDPTCGMFYYCDEENDGAWVFTIRALGTARKGLDVCEWGWLARSEPTEAWSLEEVPTASWKIWTGFLKETSIAVGQDGCNDDADCSFNGVCEEGSCLCDDNWQGRSCSVPKPYCPAVAFVNYGQSSYDYKTFGPFVVGAEDDGSTLEVYGRPLYYRSFNVTAATCTSGKRYELYLFAGGRWYLSLWCGEDLDRYNKNGEFRMEEDMHAFWDNLLGFDVKWYSEPTESYTGMALNMFAVRDSYATGNMGTFGLSVAAQGTFECLDVPCSDNAAICGRKGTCDPYSFENKEYSTTTEFHKCTCRDFYGGFYCQYNPNGYYARDHFNRFRQNSLQSSQNEYQTVFWQPLVEAGVNVSVAEEEISGETEADSLENELESAQEANASNTAGNIFSNQSGNSTEEGEL